MSSSASWTGRRPQPPLPSELGEIARQWKAIPTGRETDLTVLILDLVAGSYIAERLRAAEAHEVMEKLRDVIRGAANKWGAFDIQDFNGDSTQLLFLNNSSHAVGAALDILEETPRVRHGLPDDQWLWLGEEVAKGFRIAGANGLVAFDRAPGKCTGRPLDLAGHLLKAQPEPGLIVTEELLERLPEREQRLFRKGPPVAHLRKQVRTAALATAPPPPANRGRWRTHVLAALVALLAGLAGLWLGRNQVPKPFRADGLIATFTTGRGGPARTLDGAHFSLFSDSAWNLGSKVWYERLGNDPVPGGGPGEGFLRLHYQLAPQGDREAYAGIYTDFSPPPPEAFDATAFRRLSLRIRLGQPVAESPIRVALVLPSADRRDFNYAFPTYEIDQRQMTTEWMKIRIPFDEFGKPSHVPYAVTLDPRRVYRLIVEVISEQPAHGHVDLDDLAFEAH